MLVGATLWRFESSPRQSDMFSVPVIPTKCLKASYLLITECLCGDVLEHGGHFIHFQLHGHEFVLHTNSSKYQITHPIIVDTVCYQLLYKSLQTSDVKFKEVLSDADGRIEKRLKYRCDAFVLEFVNFQ